MGEGAEKVRRILVLGDWDADGVVSSSIVYYTQAFLGRYPIEDRSAVVDKMPMDPDRLRNLVAMVKAPYDLVVLLDVPYVSYTTSVLKMLKEHVGVQKIMYIDHHLSTVQHKAELEAVVDEANVRYGEPTVGILLEELRSRGITLHARLAEFAEVVRLMDVGKRVPSERLKLFEFTKMFSKALTIVRDDGLWGELVEWLASPLPPDDSGSRSLVERLKEIVERRDREVAEIATNLAITAVKVGDLRFIDARSAWRGRGVTALTSKLFNMLRAPVVVLTDTSKDYSLLVIKANGGRAYRIAKFLLGEGLAQDIAGHPNLAIVRVAKDVDRNRLMELLHEAAFYTS
ncbi:MAG: phosphoesterase [Desulfurococcaceae archaeon]